MSKKGKNTARTPLASRRPLSQIRSLKVSTGGLPGLCKISPTRRRLELI